VRIFTASYREHLRVFAAMPAVTLSRYLIARRHDDAVLTEIFEDAAHMTASRNLRRLTVERGGRVRFHDNPPSLEHVPASTAALVAAGLHRYRATLTPARRATFDQYRTADVAFKLVGTGSVGTRDYVVLLFGNGPADALFMQVKQELPSCYAPYLRGPRAPHQGARVADAQQRVQTLSDPFIGYTRFGGDDYLVRQLADHKASLDPATLRRQTLFAYARLCGEVLAKGHARTGDAMTLAGYAGQSTRLDEAMVTFAVTCAGQVKKDYRAFLAAHRKK
jgi:uncharacterized protein (DUF2252 family)